MNRGIAGMEASLLHGAERDFHVDRQGACSCCGFMERGLIAWKDTDGEVFVNCEECAIQHTEVMKSGGNVVAVFLPEMPKSAFSHYLRVLAWVTFAARADAISGHDFSLGALPLAFATPDVWKGATRWASLTAGLEDSSVDPVSVSDLRKARKAFAFLKERLAYTQARYTTDDPMSIIEKVGEEAFDRDFRKMSHATNIVRIRSWGEPSSSFRALARRQKN